LFVLAASVWPAAAQTAEGEPPPLVRLTFPDHPSLRFGSVFRMDLRLRLQGDARSFSPADTSDETGWELSRRRIGLQGNAFEHFEYEVERELREDGPWKDVFVNVDYFDDYQLQVGKFKLPFSQERLTGSTDLDFIHRSNVVDTLAPARDVGVTLHGRFNERAYGYDAGVFRHDGESARFGFNPGAGTTIAGRFAVRPLRRLPKSVGATRELEVAAAMTVGDVPDGLNSLRGRTTFESVFFAPVYVSGRRTRLGLDLDWRPGPFGVKAELIRVSDERRNQGIFDEDLPPLISRGWYLTGTWVLTGEAKFEGIDARTELFRGGPGAIELAMRVEYLQFGSTLEGEPELATPRAENMAESGLHAWTTGVNWYVNRWLKLQFNAIREQVVDVEDGPAGNGAVWSRVVRVQFVL
jgi:phosphate-selective porin OprO/OprP